MILYQTHVIVMYYTSVIVMWNLCNIYVVDRDVSFVSPMYVILMWDLCNICDTCMCIYYLCDTYLIHVCHQYHINMILVWYLLDPYVVAVILMIRMWWLCNMSVILILIPRSYASLQMWQFKYFVMILL